METTMLYLMGYIKVILAAVEARKLNPNPKPSIPELGLGFRV